jgi:hypothetical protein
MQIALQLSGKSLTVYVIVILRLTREKHEILKLKKNPLAAHAMDHFLYIISKIALGRDDFGIGQRTPHVVNTRYLALIRPRWSNNMSCNRGGKNTPNLILFRTSTVNIISLSNYIDKLQLQQRSILRW